MIAVTNNYASRAERSQLERRELAVGAWAEGQVENATLILESVLSEEMAPHVAAKCLISQAAFRAELLDYAGSLLSLESAAPFVDELEAHFQGAFFNQRARARKELGQFDAALTDYAGASACFQAAGDLEYEGAAVLNVAGLYLKIGQIADAHINALRAVDLLTRAESTYLCHAYDTLASVQLQSGQTEGAVASINKALELVGENDRWRKSILATKDVIEEKLLQLLGVNTVQDFETIQTGMVRRALIATGGNLTHAGNLVGLTNRGIAYVVDSHPELEPLRTKRRVRLKSCMKKTK
jgi:tetratricopeptide (TPR) repeat protein